MSGVKDLIVEAKAEIENLSAAEVAGELEARDVLLVNVREPAETEKGLIPGAVVAPRGMLEFHADPTTPHHLDGFDPARRVILYCAAGARSALSVLALRQLGYEDVAHLDGGYAAWVEAGHPVEGC